MKPLRGRKSLGGSTAKAPTRLNDSLFGTDTVEVILAVSEGPCKGLVGGASGFLVGDVPLVDPGTTTPNISNFELRVHNGVTPADSILPNLGGTGSSKNVGIDMRSNYQQVVAAGTKIQIDYLDLRFVFGRLFLTDDKGNEVAASLTLIIEVKPRSATTWGVPFTNEPPDTEIIGSGASNYRPGAQQPGSFKNAAFHETYITNVAPSGSQINTGAMWFNTAEEFWRPHIYSAEHVWIEPSGLSYSQVGSFIRWSWTDVFGSPRAGWYDQTGQQRSPDPTLVSPNDFLLIPSANQEVYAWNGVNWNDPGEQFSAPTPAGPGQFVTAGVTRSAVPREIRIPVARINEPYDIRVTRAADKESKYFFAQVTWESFQEITRDVYSFPGLALSHLTIKATDTFSSIPEFTQLWDGRIIRVPTNYDPDARTYAGFWDGTFKMAFSNNPAWVAYDLVMNSSYGKNAYYPEVMDPLACYEFGKHCDAHGFTMNEYITDPRSINETINYIVGTAGGRYVDRGDGYSTILFDADDQPAVALFTQENVLDGLFTYSFTDITSRKNDFKVSFVNPLIGWKEDRVRVYDQNSIDVQGDNPEEFIAVGCTDGVEAVKRGRLRLATALTEKTIVSFKTNRQGLYVQPFQILLVADPNAQEVITGRILSVTSPTLLQLRDEIYLEAGIPLTLSIFVGDGQGGFQARQYPIANGPGKTTTLTLASPLDVTLPEKAVFSIGTPKAFRITSIEEGEDPDAVSITAIEINRLKWAFVDGKVELGDILDKQTGPLSRFVYAVTNLQAVAVTRADGSVSVILGWTPSPSMTGGYRVYQSYEGKQSEVIGEPGSPTFEIPNIGGGYYIFTVVALSADRTTESPPAAISFTLGGGFRPVGNPLNLRLVDEPESPIFRKRDPKFAWDAATDDLLDHYKFEVLGGTNNVIYSKDLTKDTLEFVFSLEMNKAATNNNPIRSFTVKLRSVDKDGNFSEPALLTVLHPAPQTPQPKLSHTPESLFIEYTRPPGDAIGALAWVELVSGFDPTKTEPKYDGDMTPIIIPVIANQKYFVRIAVYDSYGKSGLNYSIEEAYTVLFGFDVYDPGIPSGLALTSTTVKSDTGDLLTSIKGTWNKVPGTNLSYYEFELSEGDSEDWVRHVVTTESDVFTGARAGVKYTGRVRSVSRNEIVSGWSPYVDIIAAKNMEPPGPATQLDASAAFLSVTVMWVNPKDKDLAYVEVWEADRADLSEAKLVAKVNGNFYTTQFDNSKFTKFYWVRPVNTSEIPATTFTGSVQATSAQVEFDQIKDGAIGATKFASGISPIGVVDTLPAVAGYTGPAYVTLSTDGLLYNIVDGKWVTGVDTVNIRGKLKAIQIEAINATQITGQLKNAQLETLDAVKVTGQIKETQITDNAISSQKISAGAVIAGKIAAGAVIAGTIAAQAVTAGTLAALAVTAGTIAANAVSTNELAANSVVAGKIAALAVSSDTIQANAITTAKISAGAVKASQIDASAVTTDKLAAGSIYSDKIAAGQILAVHMTANSITADAIAANSITGAKIQAGTITGDHVQAMSIGAGKIFLGNSGQALNSWLSGGNNALLDGGKISANSIAANTIKVGGRGLTVHGLAFSVDKVSRVVSWTAGGVGYINDSGSPSGWSVAAGSYATNSGTTWFYWVKDTTSVQVTQDWGTAIANSSGNAVLLCTFDGYVGLNALYAGTIIDGLRINTGTVTATQIAASTIQAGNIAAGAIQAINIGANQVTADKIGVGTLNAGQINIGSDRFQLWGNQRRMRVFSNEGWETISLGDISPWVTGSENQQAYGIVIRGPNNAEVLKASNGGVYINGAYIGTATINSASIQDATIQNAKIANLTVGGEKMQGSACTQASWGNSTGVSSSCSLYVRGEGVIAIMAFYDGYMNSPVGAGQTGLFQIQRDGGAIKNVSASFALFRPGSGDTQYYLSSMSIGMLDAPGAGNHSYTCVHTNAFAVGGTTILVLELRK
jgi:predicted phage tail protein